MDENGTPQQPGQTPPAQPAAPSPPQQPAVGPTPYATPQQPTQGSSSKKPVVIVLIILAVVAALCGLLACGVAAVAIFDSSHSIDEVAAEADPHYEAAADAIEDIDTYYDALAEVESEDREAERVELLDEVNALIAQARNDALEAQVLVETLDDSTFKTEYLAALALMNQSLDAYEGMYADQQSMEALVDDLDEMLTTLRATDDQFNGAFDFADSGDYAKAKSEADAAAAAYGEAIGYFAALAETYPDLEFELQVTIEEHLVDAATAAAKAFESEAAGNFSAADGHYSSYNTAWDAMKASPSPYWMDDWSLLWTDFDTRYEEAWEYYQQSLEAWERAQAELYADEEL